MEKYCMQIINNMCECLYRFMKTRGIRYIHTLPIREGGLGIISACNIAPAAYLSSVSQAILNDLSVF